MPQYSITLQTSGPGLYEISGQVARLIADSGAAAGLAVIFCPHTSCSLLLQENADPDVRRDLDQFFRRLVPEGMDWVVHDSEGPDDMPAHIKTALTQSSIAIPISAGRPAFGTWQGLYLLEHRARPHRRTLIVQVMAEP
jgi:secondary thiamine-phosphate synthase enzyme